MDHNEAFSAAGEARAILVVDDDPQVLKSICGMLTALDSFQVLAANSAEEAIEIWQRNSGIICSLVSDFVMPNMTGDSLALRFLGENPRLKTLFISGNHPSSLASEIDLEAGVNFLQKPFTRSEMQRALQNLSVLK